MTVVKLTAKDRKGMQTMSKNDVLTDEQKAALEAARHEEYCAEEYARIPRKITAMREELAADLRKTLEAAESADGDPVYYIDRRQMIELAVRIRVYSRCLDKKDDETFTEWRARLKQTATANVMREVSSSQSTSILANQVKANEMETWKRVAEGWLYF